MSDWLIVKNPNATLNRIHIQGCLISVGISIYMFVSFLRTITNLNNQHSACVLQENLMFTKVILNLITGAHGSIFYKEAPFMANIRLYLFPLCCSM